MSVTNSTKKFFPSGPIRFSDLRKNFLETTSGSVKTSDLYRETGIGVTNSIVPDADINENIPTIDSGTSLNVSNFRNSVKEIIVRQSGTDLNLYGDSSDAWGVNLSRNVRKVLQVTGTVGSTEPSAASFNWNGDANNLEIAVSGTIDGAAGAGGNLDYTDGEDGGQAIDLNPNHKIRFVLKPNGKIRGGGGGGGVGVDGLDGIDGVDGVEGVEGLDGVDGDGILDPSAAERWPSMFSSDTSENNKSLGGSGGEAGSIFPYDNAGDGGKSLNAGPGGKGGDGGDSGDGGDGGDGGTPGTWGDDGADGADGADGRCELYRSYKSQGVCGGGFAGLGVLGQGQNGGGCNSPYQIIKTSKKSCGVAGWGESVTNYECGYTEVQVTLGGKGGIGGRGGIGGHGGSGGRGGEGGVAGRGGRGGDGGAKGLGGMGAVGKGYANQTNAKIPGTAGKSGRLSDSGTAATKGRAGSKGILGGAAREGSNGGRGGRGERCGSQFTLVTAAGAGQDGFKGKKSTNGTAGQDGQPGQDGTAGENGQDGFPGMPGQDGGAGGDYGQDGESSYYTNPENGTITLYGKGGLGKSAFPPITNSANDKYHVVLEPGNSSFAAGVVAGAYAQTTSDVISAPRSTFNKPQLPSATLSSSSDTLTEGSTLSFTVTTANISNGTSLYWTLSGFAVKEGEFEDSFGSFTVTSNSGTFNIVAVADQLIEDNISVLVAVRLDDTQGCIISHKNITLSSNIT